MAFLSHSLFSLLKAQGRVADLFALTITVKVPEWKFVTCPCHMNDGVCCLPMTHKNDVQYMTEGIRVSTEGVLDLCPTRPLSSHCEQCKVVVVWLALGTKTTLYYSVYFVRFRHKNVLVSFRKRSWLGLKVKLHYTHDIRLSRYVS